MQHTMVIADTSYKDKRILGVGYDIFICLIIVLSVLAVYFQVTGHDFLGFDDNLYITENHHVQKGLTYESIKWAFSFRDTEKLYWHPLTWLSHMLDVELYGLESGRHLLNNVLFHILSTIALFFFLLKSTGQIWKSAFVAFLFALHPLNVESVAWASERKNVLSTFFWMLTILLYYYYSQRPALIGYLYFFSFFLMGVLAKPMVITLPFVLLLLDYWPLKRFCLTRTDFSRIGLLIAEKTPLLAVSASSVFLSIVSLHYSAVVTTDPVPMGLRVENALVSYFAYIGKMIFPSKLAVFYPYPYQIPLWKSLGSAVLLICVSLFVIRNMKTRPYSITGWFWFLGTMVPVLGLKRAGLWPALADRWSYIPHVGLFILLSWGVSDISDRIPKKRIIIPALSVLIITVLATLTFIQTAYWKNSVSLFTRAVNVTENNWLMHFNLGTALDQQGKTEDAIKEYYKSLSVNPYAEDTRYNLACALAKIGKINEAVSEYNKLLKDDPHHKNAHNNIGILFAGMNKYTEAIDHYSAAIRIDPNFDLPYINMGAAFFSLGKAGDAIEKYLKALKINPYRKITYKKLAAAYAALQIYDQEIYWYRKALQMGFLDADLYDALGIAWFRKGKLKYAASRFRQASDLEPGNVLYRKHLTDTADKIKSIRKKLSEIDIMLLQQGPETAQLNYESCVLSADIGETEQAIRHCRTALDIQSGFSEAAEQLAMLYMSVKEYEKALSLYIKLSDMQMDSADICYKIGCLYSMLDFPDKSFEWLIKSKEKGFDDWELFRTDSRLHNIRHTDFYRNFIPENIR